MIGWTVVLFGIVARSVHEVPGRALRPREHGAGRLEHDPGAPARDDPRATGEQIVRLGGHVDPFLVLLAPLWLVWPSPLALAFAQIAVVSLGALPVFWLGRRHLGSERVAGLLALAYLAYPWVATSAVAAIHPVTFAITFFSSVSGSSTRIGSCPSPSSRRSPCRPASSWGCRCSASGSGTRSREAAARRSGDRCRRARLDVLRRLRRRPAVLRGREHVLRLLRPGRRIAAGVIRTLFTDPARCWARWSRPTTSCTSSGSGCRCSSCSSSRPGSRSSRCRNSSRTGSPTSAR